MEQNGFQKAKDLARASGWFISTDGEICQPPTIEEAEKAKAAFIEATKDWAIVRCPACGLELTILPE